MLNFSSARPYLFFVFLSIVAVISFGVDITSHQLYNLSELAIMNGGVFGEDNFFGYDHSLFNPKSYYTLYIVPLLQYGVIYVVLSTVVKCASLILGYTLVRQFVEKDLAIIVTTMFMFAYLAPSHGVVSNGFWVAPGFFLAALSALTTVSGITSLTKGRYLVSGITFGLSIILHSLYGITAIAFLFLGFVMIVYKKNDRHFWPTLLTWVMPILCVVGYVAYFRIYNSTDVELTHSIDEWFRFAYSTDPEDVSLLWTLQEHGYGLVPLILSGGYLAYKEEKWKELQLLTFGAVISSILYVVIEIMHRSGIFVGMYSELFIATQLRRGIWVAALLAMIQLALSVSNRKDEIFRRKSWIVVLIFSISTYLIPSPLTVITLLSVVSVIVRKRAVILVWLITISLVAMYYYGREVDVLWQIKLVCYNILFTVSVVIMMLRSEYKKRDRSRSLSSAVLVIIVLLFTGQGVLNSRLRDSLAVLTTDGVLSKINTRVITERIGYFGYDLAADYCMRSALSVASDEKILLPVTGARNTGNGYFSAYGQVLGYHNPMYSRQDYELALRNLKSIFGGEAVEKFFNTDTYFNKTEMEEYFSGAYLDLPRSRLENLRDNAGLRFYLLDVDRSDLGNALLCKGDRYYVYDLNVL